MRSIDTTAFSIARRATGRDINRRIALNLIRVHQPISRADLARRMETTRGAVGVLINELISADLIYEGATGNAPRGRKPVFLYVRTNDRLVAAADIRVSRIDAMLSDFGGRRIALETLDATSDPREFIRRFAQWVRAALKKAGGGTCEGVGVVVPGMVDRETGRVLNAPQLGWRDVDLRSPLAKATGIPVFIESAGRACALAQMWLSREDGQNTQDFIYISISDGVGAGLVIGGELVRGHNQIAGEFGHMPIGANGPRCACGAAGCWMPYISNLATIARYTGSEAGQKNGGITVSDIVKRARRGDRKAVSTIRETGHYLGLGLAALLHVVDPASVYVGGEIVAGWDLIEPPMRAVLAGRSLCGEDLRTTIVPSSIEYPRLRGAAALVAAPIFAVPRLA